MVKAVKGVLVQCDESIKAIIEKLDKQNKNTFIIDALDDETLLVASSKINELKMQLKAFLSEHMKEQEESGSE